jgi:hypothetical protein
MTVSQSGICRAQQPIPFNKKEAQKACSGGELLQATKWHNYSKYMVGCVNSFGQSMGRCGATVSPL